MQQPDNDNHRRLADTIRRTIRVLGAQSSPASDSASVNSAARLVYERLHRAQVPVRWIDEIPHAPLIVAGRGPIAIVTYLDDSHPGAIDQHTAPPSFDEGMVRGPGIERKSGVVAALSTLLAFPELSQDLTVIVESDRHAGSIAIESWLSDEQPDFKAVFWEVADVPLNPPLVLRAAAGRLVVQVEIQTPGEHVEPVFGGVLPDVGFALANLLAQLKTSDEEIRLNGFYDGIISPEEEDFQSLLAVAPEFSNWLRRVTGGESQLETAHLTLGIFCAPSVIVHDMDIMRRAPYLPQAASAIVEFHLMPGQSVERTLDTLQTHVQDSHFVTKLTPLLARSPAPSSDALRLPPGTASLPLAPGPSPAALFIERGIPCVGYAVVGRRASGDEDGIALDSIVAGAWFLLSLADSLSTTEGAASD